MSNYGKFTILFEAGGDRFKVTKIWFGADGSYYVTCPYHPAQRAHLFVRTINYNDPAPPNRPSQLLTEAVALDDRKRIKLSHHPSGFLQFSGQGIISGKNRDGTAK